jgi:hypothetical protein
MVYKIYIPFSTRKGGIKPPPQLVEKLFWDAEGGVPYKIIYEQ